MIEWDDVRYIETNMQGQVILQAGLDTSKLYISHELSIQVPETFAKVVLLWKNTYDMVKEKLGDGWYVN